MAEKRETAKTAFRPRPKLKKSLKNGFPIPWKWGKSFKNGFLTSWKQERQMLQLNSHE